MSSHLQDMVIGFVAGFGWGGIFGVLTGLFVGAEFLGRFMESEDDDDDEPGSGSEA